jgi:hypothetical protein
MKKAITVLLLVGLLAVMIPAGAALADDNDTQIIDGNIESAITLTVVKHHTGLSWTVGGTNENPQSAAVNVKSNIAYDLDVKADSAALREWDGTDYVTPEVALQTDVQTKVNTGSFTTLTTSYQEMLNAEVPTVDDGTDYDTTVKQAIGYGDSQALGGNTYHGIFTWQASAN